MNFSIFLPFLVAVAVAYVCTYFVIPLAKRFNLVTDKRKRHHPAHVHTGIIPRAGGVPIYVSLLITTLLFVTLNKIIIGILISSFVLIVLGLFDDYYDLSPYLRLVINIWVAALVIGSGLGIPYISNPFGGVIRLDTIRWSFDLFGKHSVLVFADLLAIFWLTALMNMVSWSKGLDGQLPGFVGITAYFLGLLATRFTAHDISAQQVTILAFIVAGAFIGFMPYNFYPQRIMPGYGGGTLAGFLLGILSILSFGKVGTAILILAIPLIDAFYTIVRRVLRGRSPFFADRGHFHHRLMDIGWGKRRIALFYWGISFMLGIFSLFLKGMEKFLAFVTIAVLLLIFIAVIERMKKESLAKNNS